MAGFGDYQNEIYFRGLSGIEPKFPVDFATLEKRARAALSDARIPDANPCPSGVSGPNDRIASSRKP